MHNVHIKQKEIAALINSLKQDEWRRTSGKDAMTRYDKIHAARFRKTVEICKKIAPRNDIEVLDVGPSYLTTLLVHEYPNVTTLGFDLTSEEGGQWNNSTVALGLPHITFDLNNAYDVHRWPKLKKQFDFIILAETLEHLPTAPEYTLLMLRSFLSENGILFITTPNAAAIMKRLILLLKGRNPFERIRMNTINPGHYREYTMQEIIDIGKRCRLQPRYTRFINFYEATNFLQTILKSLHASFHDSIVVAFHKNK